jgi:Mlc titration factor MtfA (ptsG expression regulator)
VLGLIRRWRRKKLRREPLPAGWLGHIEARCPFFADYDEATRRRFLDDVKVFVAEKHFFPGGELEAVTEEMQVVIAASAVRLVVHLDVSYYDRLREIVVYPGTYRHPDEEGGVLGEAHDWGVVVLSWDAVVQGLANPDDGHDTAIHELAHVLDRASGAFDGTPVLHSTGDYGPWGRVMSRHFLALRDGTEAGRRSLLRQYGATNEAEFFAVATETFFERPALLRDKCPELYEELARFYRVEPGNDGTPGPAADA